MQDEQTPEQDEREANVAPEDYVTPELTRLGTLQELTGMPFSGSSGSTFPTSA